MMRDVSLCFVHFRSLDLRHLDNAWYSLSRQSFDEVNSVFFLDNNTEQDLFAIQEVLNRHPLPVPLYVCFDKHGRNDRTQSWSVNRVCQEAFGPWVFFTRSDYILTFNGLDNGSGLTDAVDMMVREAKRLKAEGQTPFVSGWCWQMAYDRNAQNIEAHIDIEQYHWRERGTTALLNHPFAFRFHETDQDAGVWCTEKDTLAKAGWMNEKLVSWGYQQSTFQREIRTRAGGTCVALQAYLFAHQHHFAVRDHWKARDEYSLHGASR